MPAQNACWLIDDGDLVLRGISLIDGSGPRSCDARFCDPVRIAVEDVANIKRDFDSYVRRRSAELDPTVGQANVEP